MVNFFQFPLVNNNQRRSYPLEMGDDHLSFTFIEVGCSHKKKRSQLNHKKELFLKYWGDTFRSDGSVEWVPKVFRILSHYNNITSIPVKHDNYSVDALVRSNYISKEHLNSLSLKDKELIFNRVYQHDARAELKNIFKTNDAYRLNDLIVSPDMDNGLPILRGVMAEVLIQKSVDSIIENTNIINFKNPYIDYADKRFDNSAEVDQILQFYGVEPFYNLIEGLSKLDHLTVYSDTKKIIK